MEGGGDTLGNFFVSSSVFSAVVGRLGSRTAVCGREVYPRGPIYPIGINGMGTSSSNSSSDDSEVALSSCSSPASSSDSESSSLSLDSSVQVDGSYSCFRGEDERRLPLKPGSVGRSTGVLEPFNVSGLAGLGERCGGVGGGGTSVGASGS